jgi:serine/threonine protein kinase
LDLFRAIHHIHSNEHGMIHSDIKPANLLISEDDRLCLCDFGISDKTGAKLRGGTTSYLAPEALCKDAVLTTKIDIYACGITLAEMAHQSTFKIFGAAVTVHKIIAFLDTVSTTKLNSGFQTKDFASRRKKRRKTIYFCHFVCVILSGIAQF